MRTYMLFALLGTTLASGPGGIGRTKGKNAPPVAMPAAGGAISMNIDKNVKGQGKMQTVSHGSVVDLSFTHSQGPTEMNRRADTIQIGGPHGIGDVRPP